MPGTMVGTVWHPERMHRAEGDERRYCITKKSSTHKALLDAFFRQKD